MWRRYALLVLLRTVAWWNVKHAVKEQLESRGPTYVWKKFTSSNKAGGFSIQN
jgi:hypothetical protein